MELLYSYSFELFICNINVFVENTDGEKYFIYHFKKPRFYLNDTNYITSLDGE